ncbi:MAG: DUF2399 domain-containing protein, partial [Thermoproteota archaeon]|nr:DUF2399 domain-containing protein [Thermoproteota archaeon]
LNGTFPACQTINLPLPYNPNFTSIWYYSLADFSKFIFGLSNNETFVYTMIKEQFREGTRLKKILETVGELKNDHKKINKLHYDLRGAFESREQIDVPFSINKKQRKEALKQRIEQIGVEIDNDTDVRYQQKVGTYSGGDGVIFPFLFEIMVVETNQISSNLFLTEGINGSPNYYMLQGKYSNTFQWHKNNKRHDASSITQMLGEYGYSMNKQVCKRKAIIVINLISPRIEYDNYGKSIMEFTPFEDAISESVHKVCTNRSSTDVKGNTVRGLLTELLQERLDAVRTDPSLKDTDRWTMSGVFYRLRPKLIDKGMKVNRDSITSDIRMVCEERLLDENGEHKKYTRDELGIIAADRAQLYFDGQWYNVGIDEIEELSKKGADVLIIEKEGVAEVLSNFADELGIALLNTRGFVVEYAEILSNKSAENGANVAILTDFDIDGLKIARTLPNTYRIGIDFNTLEYFGLEKRDVEEAYAVDDKKEKSKKHAESTYLMLKAKGSALGQDAGIFKESIEYARRMRIEIDSVLMQVGNEEFWDFLVDKLDEKFPTRNYNRSVQVPESVTPDVVDEFIQRLQNKIKMLLKPEYENERVKLENFEGMLNDGIEQKKEEIIRRFKDIVSKDENLKVTLEKIQKLNDEIE